MPQDDQRRVFYSHPFPLGNGTKNGRLPEDYGDGHEVKFTKTEGCTPSACVCALVAILFVSVGAASGIYFGLHYYDTRIANEKVFKGSFTVTAGDPYRTKYADPKSEEFQNRAELYKNKMDTLFNNSEHKNAFVNSEITAFDRGKDGSSLVVHFNLHLIPKENEPIDAPDIYVVIAEEIMNNKVGVFRGLRINPDTIDIQERKAVAAQLRDPWSPKARFPGLLEGLTTLSQPTPAPRRCGALDLPFCQDVLPYNMTSYPNLVNHWNLSQVERHFITFRQVADSECYPLAREFICQLLQPECHQDQLVMPCKEFCKEFWNACEMYLPASLTSAVNCDHFPSQKSSAKCRSKPGCSKELMARGQKRLICDGVLDCEDRSDESDCDYCKPGQFYCGDKQCVDIQKQCDSKVDCLNGADERHCLSLSASSPTKSEIGGQYHKDGVLRVTEKGKTKKVCATVGSNDTFDYPAYEDILENLALSACMQMHYSVVGKVKIIVDEDADAGENYVRMKSPNSAEMKFATVPCESREVYYLSCTSLECGANPSHTPANRRVPTSSSADDVHAALPGDWPWHAVLLQEGKHVCDATLVTNEWLLSPSSCFSGEPSSTWTVRLGTVRLFSTSPFVQERQVVTVIHSPPAGGNLSLIKIDSPINGSDYVRPSCLPEEGHLPPLESQECVVLTWDTKSQLRHFKAQITETELCSFIESSESDEQPKHICVFIPKGSQYLECRGSKPPVMSLLCKKLRRWTLMGFGGTEGSCSDYPIQHLTFISVPAHAHWVNQMIRSWRQL